MKTEELHEKYRKAKEPVEQTHWHILLVKEDHTPCEVAEQIGYTACTGYLGYPFEKSVA